MVGEAVVRFLETIGEQPLERLARSCVEIAPACRQETVVGHLLSQRVLEHVGAFRPTSPLIEELLVGEQRRVALERARSPPDGLDELPRELPTEDGSRLEDVPGLLRDALDPREQDFLDRVGNGRHRTRMAMSLDGAADLFDEERVAFGLVEDQLGHGLRDVVLDDGTEHAPTIVGRQR